MTAGRSVKHRSASAGIVGIALVLGGWNCGGSGDSDGNRSDEALDAVTASSKPALEALADDLAKKASLQVTSAGTLDLKTLASDAQREASPVQTAVCKAIDENKSVRKPPDGTGQPDQFLEEFIKLEAARAVGRYPVVVYAAKPAWPHSWLRDGAAIPTYDLDAPKVDPMFLKSILQDRFVGADGAFLPPDRSMPDYPTFNSWLKQSSNSFDVLLFSLTQPVTSAIRNCLG